MKKHFLFTVALLLVQQFFFCSANLFAQAPDFVWAKKGGGPELEEGRGIAVDAAGNSYVTGIFSVNATFGNTMLISDGGHDIFIAKYDASGNEVWARKGGGALHDEGQGIAVDASGNSYVTGTIGGSATFGSTTLNGSGGSKMFIAKYDPLGNVLWAKSGGIGVSFGQDLAVDASGNSYVTGTFIGNATFGSNTLTSNGGTDMFIAKFDVAGNVLWARKGGGADNDRSNSIAVDALGNSYLTGSIDGGATFGNITLTSNGVLDLFIVKYDASGNLLWAKSGGGTGNDIGNGITVDANGNSLVTGLFEGSASFGNTILTSSGVFDMFIVKYDGTGNVLWAKKGGGTSYDRGNDIAIDGNGDSYVTGYFEGIASFDNVSLTSSGWADTYITKYDALGNVLWARKGGGVGNDIGKSIAINSQDNCFITGFFQGSTTTFSSITLTNSGNSDIFIAKLGTVVNGLKEETDKANIQVYPNPFTSTFNITLPALTSEPLHIRMTDVLGREVYRQTLATDAAGVVSVSPSKSLPAGLYQLQVQTAKATFTKKLVVE